MVTSTDGLVTATAESGSGGVALKAVYTSTWGVTDTFESNATGWSNQFGATVARTTSSPINGTGSLLWTRNSASSVVARTLPAFPSKPYTQKVVVYFTAKTTAAGDGIVVTADWTGSQTGHCELGIATTDVRRMLAVFYINANTVPTAQLLLGADPNNDSGTLNSGNLVLDDFVVEVQPPTSIYLFRNGDPVRGCSPSPAADGVAYGYDYEATNGALAAYTAQPVFDIRDTVLVGPVSAEAALTVPDIAGSYSMWLKSTTNPNLSRKAIGKWPAPDRAWEGRDSLAANPGAGLMSGSWDVPVRQPETWVIETVNATEHRAMETLLTSGPLLLQWSVKFDTDDLYAVPKTISWNYKRGPMLPERLWTVSFQPIAAPPSEGAPLVIAGKSYGDLFAKYGIYSAVASSLTSYDQWFDVTTPPVVTPPATAGGFGQYPYGTTPFGV